MKKRILLAASALALTAGSIFAFSGAEQTAKNTSVQCPPECCNGDSGNCGPNDCKNGGTDCCEE